jgi:hypothetical protein
LLSYLYITHFVIYDAKIEGLNAVHNTTFMAFFGALPSAGSSAASPRFAALRSALSAHGLEIIRKVPAFDTREALLAKLNGGHAWFYLSRDIFPQLRRVELLFEFSATPDNRPLPTNTHTNTYNNIDIAAHPSGGAQMGTENGLWRTNSYDTGNSSRPQYAGGSRYGSGGDSSRLWISSAGFVFKTNLLLAAGIQSDFSYTIPAINGALEYRIDVHWSVEFGMIYSYWHYNSRREFQGVSGYRLEPRYRLGLWNGRFGIYSGLYGRSGDYNVRRAQETGDTDDTALPTRNHTGKYWDAGVSLGVTFKLVGGLGLEAGIRCGYVSSSPYKYILDEDQIPRIESRWKYSKVGITDLNISLTYQFSIDN